MKKSILLLVLAILLSFCVPNALADPEDYQGQTLPDFTVIKYDGATFTLSESLKTHELVLINFWATWYGPCLSGASLEAVWRPRGCDCAQHRIPGHAQCFASFRARKQPYLFPCTR